jgi:hypothetical protein
MYHPTFEEIQRMDKFVEEMTYYFKAAFSQYSRSLVRNVVYIESWSDYEESTGLAIYQDWNGYFYSVHFGHSVMGNNSGYNPQQITEDIAIESMIEMDALLVAP